MSFAREFQRSSLKAEVVYITVFSLYCRASGFTTPATGGDICLISKVMKTNNSKRNFAALIAMKRSPWSWTYQNRDIIHMLKTVKFAADQYNFRSLPPVERSPTLRRRAFSFLKNFACVLARGAAFIALS